MKCRMCGCTEEHACASGCAWAPGEGNLCTTCYEAVIAVAMWLDEAHRPNWAALKREASQPPKALTAGGAK